MRCEACYYQAVVCKEKHLVVDGIAEVMRSLDAGVGWSCRVWSRERLFGELVCKWVCGWKVKTCCCGDDRGRRDYCPRHVVTEVNY